MKKFNFSILFLLAIVLIITITSSLSYSFAETGIIPINSLDVKYTIENGKIESIYLDPDFNQLVVTMTTNADGTLEIVIPRDILDAKFELNDDMFYVLVDGFETDFVETESNSTSRILIIPFFKGDSIIEIIGTNVKNQPISNSEINIPSWIKNNASWWASGLINDSDFLHGIEYMIKENIIMITELPQSANPVTEEIPTWVKNTARWWADDLIEENDFVKGIQFLVQNGIINV